MIMSALNWQKENRCGNYTFKTTVIMKNGNNNNRLVTEYKLTFIKGTKMGI